MKNLPIKKLLTALAFAGLVTGLAVLLADLLYQPKILVKRGYQIEVAGQDGKIETKKQQVTLDIATMIKTANIDMGAKTLKKCLTCHNAEKDAGSKIGPNLFGVVGRKKASFPGFAYSDAMKSKGGSWTYEELNQFLSGPRNYIPGTKMTFVGLKKDQDRANVIAYLEKIGKQK